MKKQNLLPRVGGSSKVHLTGLMREGHILLTSPPRHYCHKIKTAWVTAGLSWHVNWRGLWETTSRMRPFKNSSVVHLPLTVRLRGLKEAQTRTGWKYRSQRSDPSSSMDTQSFCFILNPNLSQCFGNSGCTQWLKQSTHSLWRLRGFWNRCFLLMLGRNCNSGSLQNSRCLGPYPTSPYRQ